MINADGNDHANEDDDDDEAHGNDQNIHIVTTGNEQNQNRNAYICMLFSRQHTYSDDWYQQIRQ